ncbi:MAG: hypothetical protein D6705_04880 [Deltaproteobacteria bacterium]|nr:MAG: hypothetical protein D6705_04880 [Deltaproteobacteria bacterium]
MTYAATDNHADVVRTFAFASIFTVGLAVAPSTGHGAPAGDLDWTGRPITAPDYDPEVIGIGHTDPGLPAFDSPTILFTNFDGADLNSGCGNDPRNNCSVLSFQFGGKILPYSGDAAERASIVQAVRKDVEDFGVIVLGERPPDNQPYAMVLVGNSAVGGVSEHGFAGVAPTIDCGNTNPYITSFALEVGGVNSMATVINQEAAHTWGLEHVNNPADNLHPVSGGHPDPKYTDSCDKIVANTDLDPANGQCNAVHTMFCNAGYQNSYQEMLALFGPPIPDDVAPSVTIDNPGEGDVLDCPVEFDLVVTLDDDRRPQTMSTTIYLDDQEVLSGLFIDSTLSFPVSGGIAPGMHTFRVEIEDESGNPASAEVNFEVATNPGDPMCAAAPDPTDGTTAGDVGTDGGTDGGTAGANGGSDEGCGCRTSHGGPAGPMGAFVSCLFVGVAIRRRRGA